jgi:cellulose synthase/poly-beta-1,6-N-acetylglucosamine synthase-like glycosyltransferase
MTGVSLLTVVFWAGALLLLYIYVLYPALCWLRARVSPRPWKTAPEFRPAVSVLVAAYNEAHNIRDRILNIAAQQPGVPFEILVGSDGSTDRTCEIAQAAAGAASIPVHVFNFPRAGKAATLTRLLDRATGDVVVFTDANCAFASGALRAIVAPLADPEVGCAGGMKRISSGHLETADGEKSYWGFENRLKIWESAFGSCAGADGALYAVRRRDLPQLVTNRLLADDLYISLAACANGRRCVLVPDGVAVESSDTNSANELRRKARILAGALASILLVRRLLLPGSGLSLALWSHKLLRWFSFVPICGMIVGAFGLTPHAAGLFFFAAGMCAAAALAGVLFPSSLRSLPVKVPYYFALMNFGQILGLMEWIRRGHEPTWEKVR